MKPRAIPVLILLAFAWVCLTSIASAITYDASADFSSVSNPSPDCVWKHGYTVTRGSPLVLHDQYIPHLSGPVDAWQSSSNLSLFGKNNGAVTESTLLPGRVALHPGSGNQYSVLRFTAPSAGSYTVAAQFFQGDPGDTDAYILLNSNPAWLFFAATTDTNPAYSSALTLHAGDTVDFVVGSKGNYFQDTTPLQVSIIPPNSCRGQRVSINYRSAPETVDAGGRHATSASGLYSSESSIGGIGGISTGDTPPETAKGGYIGQLYETTGLTLTAASMTVNETETLQLAAWQVLDDDTFLAVPAVDVAWSVVIGPITGISSGGLATAGIVVANTAATVQGAYLGFTGTLDRTVVNTPLGILRWTGPNNGTWNTTTQNWTNGGIAAFYVTGDTVTFDDSAAGGTVNIAASGVAPAVINIINSARNYTITGPGLIGITGGADLNKSGTGVLTLSGANTYTGVTTVSGGVLRLEDANALPGGTGALGGTSNLTFNGGVIGLGVGNSPFTRSLNTTASGATFIGAGGWAAYGSNATVNLGGMGATIDWGAADTGFNGRTLILGASRANLTVGTQSDKTVSVLNALNLGAEVRTVQVENGSAPIDGRLTGVISGTGTGGLLKTGSGALSLDNPVQSYDNLTANAGTTYVNGVLGTAPGLAAVTVSNAGTTVQFTVSQTLDSLVIGDCAIVILGGPPPQAPPIGADPAPAGPAPGAPAPTAAPSATSSVTGNAASPDPVPAEDTTPNTDERGHYTGLFDSGTADAAKPGIANFTVGRKGRFTGGIRYEGRGYRLIGKFDANGQFVGVARGKGEAKLAVSLQLDRAGETEKLTGTISDHGKETDFVADRVGLPPNLPIVLQVTAEWTETAAGGDSAIQGLVRVQPNGTVRLARKLGDGMPFSAGGQFTKKGLWPYLIAPRRSSAGAVSGVLSLSELETAHP